MGMALPPACTDNTLFLLLRLAGASSKTLMFVNLSPSLDSAQVGRRACVQQLLAPPVPACLKELSVLPVKLREVLRS